MEPEPVVEPTPAPASERPVRAAAQKAAQKREEEAEAAAKKKAASGKATAAALQKKLAAQKEAASAVEAAQKVRIEELEAELLRQQVRAAEAEASPRSAYGTPAKGQGHVSEENDNLEVELEAALGDEGEGAGEGASAPEVAAAVECEVRAYGSARDAACLPFGVVGEPRRKLSPITTLVLLLGMGVDLIFFKKMMDIRVSAEFPSSRQACCILLRAETGPPPNRP